MESQVLGRNIRTMGAYFRKLDPAVWERIERGISPELRLLFENARAEDWYPYAHYEEGFKALIATCDDPVEARNAVYRVGRAACEATVNTFLRLVLRMMTPGLFARKCNQLLGADFKGFPGGAPVVKYDLSRESQGEAIIELTNAGNHPFLGASAVGYIEFAFEHMGKKGVKVEERDCDVADFRAPFARWYVTWKP